MSVGYISPPLDSTPSGVVEDALEYIETQKPGWQAAPGGIDTLIIEALAEPASESNELASAALTAVFRYFGKLVNLPVIDASPATVTVEYTVQDVAGYTIDAGSTIGLRDADGELWGFNLIDDLAVAPGSTTASGMAVAEVSGTGADGLSGTAELVSTPAFVTAAYVASASANGVDAEDDTTYLDRLSEALTLLTPRPVLPGDFAVLARNVPGVWRATAVDLLKPGPPYDGTAEASPVADSVVVAVTDAAGADPGSTIRTAALTYLRSLVAQNSNVYVVAANYTEIDVSATVQAMPGQDPSEVQAQAVAALTDALSPLLYASPTRGGSRQWLNDPTLRASLLYAALGNVDVVRYVSALTFGLHGGSLGTANVTLGSGSLLPALPTPGTITVTVTS